MMRSTPATIDASSVTSMAKGMMPRDSSAAMRSTRRATAYTVHPDSTRWMAMDSPMPEDAPVTRATLLIPTPYAAPLGPERAPISQRGPAGRHTPLPHTVREATSGRLDAVERPALGGENWPLDVSEEPTGGLSTGQVGQWGAVSAPTPRP